MFRLFSLICYCKDRNDDLETPSMVELNLEVLAMLSLSQGFKDLVYAQEIFHVYT